MPWNTLRCPGAWVLVSAVLSVCASAAREGPIAHWDFDEGRGDVLHDRSGNGNDGKIRGAAWVRSGAGFALRFDGQDDYVDCGKGESLDLTGPLTLMAWAMPTAANRGEPGIAGKFFTSYAMTYYGDAFFYISSGGNKAHGPTKVNEWSHLAGTFDGKTLRFYVNGIEVDSSPTRFDAVNPGNSFYIGCIFGDPTSPDAALRNTSFFPGLIDDVRVYDRALSQKEIIQVFNEEAAGKGLEPIETSMFGKFLLEPFFYPDEDRLVLSVNSRWALPLPPGADVVAELAPKGDEDALQVRSINPNAPRNEDEASFSLRGLRPGNYELRVFAEERSGVIQAEEPARKAPSVVVDGEGWFRGIVDLRGGWAEYEVETGAGAHRLFVRAGRIHDSAGIRCTIDGRDPTEANLNGPRSGGDEAIAAAKWDMLGAYELSAGQHTLRVECIPARDKDGKTYGRHTYIDAFALEAVAERRARAARAQRVAFDYPLPPPAGVPSPEDDLVEPLPAPVKPPEYEVDIAPGGGLLVTVKGKTFRVESSYSYPHGGFNRLVAGAPDTEGEPEWRVRRGAGSRGRLRATATGKFYGIERTVERADTRILVKDTIRNRSGDVLGIILSNHVNVRGIQGVAVTQMTNPTVFVAQEDVGLGLIALDDLYQLQQRNSHSDGLVAIRDEHFGLDKGASYTIEWAIYPTATGDYYDFINQVRHDEGLNARVEGTWTGMSRSQRPSREFIDLFHARYLSLGTPWYPIDAPPEAPRVSIEGIEFMEYPKECARVRNFFDAVKRAHPDVGVMIHVAHGLYCCNRPEQLFPDSRALDENGRQLDYGSGSENYYTRYWSKEMFDDNWRWWIFYPSPHNSFGKAMIRAMEYMMDEMGATGMWADGYISGYVRGMYSYDRWDGHSVTIDPRTKLVTRKKNLVPYTALPVLRQVIRLIAERGGVLITNGHPGPRSLWREHYLTSNETGGGDARPIGGLHLGRSVTPLGNPGAIKNERDIYRDILRKLDYGALYWWYGGRGLVTHKTLVEHMYPITFESIHAGVVRGKERIITKRSGVYGWPRDRHLHAVYLYDARGALTTHDFVTTVDGAGARTRVRLGKDQSAAVVRIPVQLESQRPLNVRVLQYDGQAVRLAINGNGRARLRIENGGYPVQPGRSHEVALGERRFTVAGRESYVAFEADITGPTEVAVGAVEPR